MADIGVGTAPALGNTAGRAVAGHAVLAANSLLVLDDVWTAQAEGLSAASASVRKDELPDLAQLVEDLGGAVRELAVRGARLRAVLNDASDRALEDGLDAVLAASQQQAELRDILAGDLLSEELGGYRLRSAAIAACDYVVETAEDEIEQLHTQLGQLRHRGDSVGDVRPPFRCAAWLVLMAGGVAVAVGGGGAPAIIAASIGHEVGMGIFGWKESQCKQAWRVITGGRRG